MIDVYERFGLFVIFQWRTSKRQFIPESQQGAGLTRFADISNALAVQLAFPDTFFRYPGQLLIAGV